MLLRTYKQQQDKLDRLQPLALETGDCKDLYSLYAEMAEIDMGQIAGECEKEVGAGAAKSPIMCGIQAAQVLEAVRIVRDRLTLCKSGKDRLRTGMTAPAADKNLYLFPFVGDKNE